MSSAASLPAPDQPTARRRPAVAGHHCESSETRSRVRPPHPGQSDKHGAITDLHLVHCLANRCRKLVAAIHDIKLPAMPGAGKNRPAEHTCAERTALVGTQPVDRMQPPLDVGQGHYLTGDHPLNADAGRTFVEGGDFDPVGHRAAPHGFRHEAPRSRSAGHAAERDTLPRGGAPRHRRCTHQYCAGARRIACSRRFVYHCDRGVRPAVSAESSAGSAIPSTRRS